MFTDVIDDEIHNVTTVSAYFTMGLLWNSRRDMSGIIIRIGGEVIVLCAS